MAEISRPTDEHFHVVPLAARSAFAHTIVSNTVAKRQVDPNPILSVDSLVELPERTAKDESKAAEFV